MCILFSVNTSTFTRVNSYPFDITETDRIAYVNKYISRPSILGLDTQRWWIGHI